ncbi:MAG TPA: hypothetical protein VMQ61_14730 [Thermoanaerobaculia bacterium]|nr:hypothetical protein [Thermoanaerobaculia bacterium]
MLRKLSLVLLAAALAAPLAAQQVTKKFDYAPVNGVQDLKFELDKVSLNQITFKPGKSLGAGIRKSDAAADVRVDNNGAADKIVGVAVVMFDGEGNVVAAGSSGTHVGYLKAGERDIARIEFPYVFRHMDKAKTFVVTMEMADRPKD